MGKLGNPPVWGTGDRRFESDYSDLAFHISLCYKVNMKAQMERTYEAKLYLGSKEAYNGREFSFKELTDFIGKFQHERELTCPLRITQCHFMFEDYLEKGWEVAVINYPRFPKDTVQLKDFMCDLATDLLEHFNQNRISVVCPDLTHMFERNEAECCHVKEED